MAVSLFTMGIETQVNHLLQFTVQFHCFFMYNTIAALSKHRVGAIISVFDD